MADTLDPNDFARAQSALAQALAVAGPILGALQQASTVFDLIQNASIHRTALERDVADLMQQADQAKASRQSWDQMSALSMQRATDAEAEANARCEKAHTDAEETLTQLHDSMSLQIAAAQAEATDRLQAITAHVVAAQAEHDLAMQNLAAAQAAAQDEFDAISRKLDTLKVNAARFAAALQG